MISRRVLPLLALLAGAAACAPEGTDIQYNPAPQLIPHSIQKIALRHVINKTQQFGLEDKLTIAVRDEFLRNGQWEIVPENQASGIVQVTINLYVLQPLTFDASLVPTSFKLRIGTDVQLIDVKTHTALWDQPNIEAIQTYAADTLPGGMTEEMAREACWDILAREIVKRVISGFGTVMGTAARRVSGETPSTPPPAEQEGPNTPIISNPY
jgi:hypothetical protein